MLTVKPRIASGKFILFKRMCIRTFGRGKGVSYVYKNAEQQSCVYTRVQLGLT